MRPADNIEESIKKLRYKTDTETREKLLDNVLQTLDKHEEQKSGPTGPDIWRTIMNTKMRKLATAAAILIAATIVLYFIAGPISTTSTVYAEVAERLQKARTLLYSVTTMMHATKIEVAFKEPGYMRMSMPGDYITVMDWTEGKGLSIVPPKKQFIEMDIGSMPDDAAQRQFDAIERLRTLPDRADEDLGEQTISSRAVHGFRVIEGDMINSVWIDPATRELVLVEMEFANAPGMGATMTDFQFDVELEDSLFSLTPPDGYFRMDVQVDASATSETDLIEYLRLWSSWTKDHTFPPTFHPIELQKASMEMAEDGMFGGDNTSDQERFQHAMKMARGIVFVTQLSAEGSQWRYAGENVRSGDAETAIFWYQPSGSATYRVIHGDLSVKDVAPEDLPQ